jgi:hypothetical protein
MLQAQNGEDVQNDGNGEMLSLPETISIENYSLSYCWQAQKILVTSCRTFETFLSTSTSDARIIGQNKRW